MWKLSRWKPCDGGCCVRSPRFPRDPDNPAMSDCVYHENEVGGDPQGANWRGGCRLLRELNANLVSRGAAEALRGTDFLSTPTMREMNRRDHPAQGPWKGQPLQWFLDTCWGWPVRLSEQLRLLARAQELGLWNPVLYASGIELDEVYTDEERDAFQQTFHITSDMTQAEREAQEPACCYYWEQVDG